MNLDKVLSNLYKNYGENPGKMLVHTGTAGWILSCAAQLMAIWTNDKIPPEQKTFLIPQELGDGLINILSFYILTSSVKNLSSKAVLNGKIANKAIRKYLEKHNLTDKIGKIDFNIKKTENFGDVKEDFNAFKNGVDVIASTAGSILSCNIVTPILRNEYAAKQQVAANNVLAQKKENEKTPYNRFTMKDYQSILRHPGMRI